MEVHKVGRTSPGGEHQVVEKAQTGTCIRFCFRDNSSVRLNSLGPLCLWQCLKYISQKVCSVVFMNEFLLHDTNGSTKNNSSTSDQVTHLSGAIIPSVICRHLIEK